MRRLRPRTLHLALALLGASVAGVGVGHALGMSVTSGHVWAGGQSLTKSSCSLGSATATWVDESNPTQTNAGATTLQIQNNNKKANVAFLRFDLSSCNLPTSGGADRATLTLTVASATRTNHTISLYPVSSSWSPSTLSWDSAQSLAIGSSATASFPTTAGTQTLTVTGDVDAAIKAGTLWGWELVDAAGPGNATTEISAAASLEVAGER